MLNELPDELSRDNNISSHHSKFHTLAVQSKDEAGQLWDLTQSLVVLEIVSR